MQAAVSGRFGREERRRGGTGRRSRLKILIYTKEQLGHCHLPTSGRLIERAHEVLTQPAGDSKLGQGANLLLVSGWDFNLDRWLHARMAVSARGRERLRARSFGAQRTLNSQRQSRSHLGGRATVPGRFVSTTAKVNVARAATF